MMSRRDADSFVGGVLLNSGSVHPAPIAITTDNIAALLMLIQCESERDRSDFSFIIFPMGDYPARFVVLRVRHVASGTSYARHVVLETLG